MFGTSSFGITIRNTETWPNLVFIKQSAVSGERQLGWLSITYLHMRQPNACRDPVTYVKSDSEIPCSDLSGFSFQVIYRDAHPGGRSPLQGIPTTAWRMFQHIARDVQSMLSACIHLCSAPLLNLHDLCEGHGNVTENDHMQPEGPITQVPLHGNLPAASLTLFILLLPPKFPSSRSPAALTCIPSVFIHICRIALILKEER